MLPLVLNWPAKNQKKIELFKTPFFVKGNNV